MSADACRSGLLVAWLRAWRAGACSYDDVLEHVTDTDEPHRVTGLPGGNEQPLGTALLALRDEEPLLALVAPGDPRGLPGPGALTDAALDAGEAVVGRSLGLVPTVTRYGSAAGSGTLLVRWQAYPVDDHRPDPPDVAMAEHELTDALREATSELVRMDVASWRPEPADAVAALRRPAPPPALPPGFDARSQRLLDQADRLARVLALAGMDAPGGAVTGAEARGRQETLAGLAIAVRRARMAAYNAPVHVLDRGSRHSFGRTARPPDREFGRTPQSDWMGE